MERFHKLEQEIVSHLLLGMSREDVKAIYIDASVGILRGIITDSAEKLAEMKIKPEEAGTVVWPYLEMMIRERSHIAFSTMCSTRLSGKELWEVLTPKIISEKYISSEELRLKGIIDRIEVNGNEHIPYEIKSGSSPRTGAWPGHRIQMAAYLLLLSEHLNRKVGLGYISYMESERNVPVVMKEAILGKSDNRYVFVVANKKAMMRHVELGLREGALRDAMTKAMTKMVETLNAIPFQSRILSVKGASVIIRAGTKSKLPAGTVLGVYRQGDDIMDPDTGRVIGKDENKIGELMIVSHMSDKLSKVDVRSGTGFKAGDLIKAIK